METEEYEGGALSTRRFAVAAWVSIPAAALAFVMAGVSISDILSQRPGPGEVPPVERPRAVPQAAVTPLPAVLPGIAEGDLLLARLRAEAAAEEARVAALREATEREAALALAMAAEEAAAAPEPQAAPPAPEPVLVPPPPALLAMAVMAPATRAAVAPRPAARPAEPSRPRSIPASGPQRRAGGAPAGGAASRPARDRRCGALLARLQLGERPTDGERAFLRSQCGAGP